MKKLSVLILIAILVFSTVAFAIPPDPAGHLISKKYTRLGISAAGNAFTGAQFVSVGPAAPVATADPCSNCQKVEQKCELVCLDPKFPNLIIIKGAAGCWKKTVPMGKRTPATNQCTDVTVTDQKCLEECKNAGTAPKPAESPAPTPPVIESPVPTPPKTESPAPAPSSAPPSEVVAGTCPKVVCPAPPDGCRFGRKTVDGCPVCDTSNVICEGVSAESKAIGDAALKNSRAVHAFAKDVLKELKDPVLKDDLTTAIKSVNERIVDVMNAKGTDLEFLGAVKNLVAATKVLSAVTNKAIDSIDKDVSGSEQKKADELRKKSQDVEAIARERASIAKDLEGLQKETEETQSRFAGIKERLKAIFAFFGLA